MDSNDIIISSDILKPKQLAELKDRLLNYLLDSKKVCLLELMFKDINHDNLQKEDFEMCLDEMMQEKMITKKNISSSRSIYYITDNGKRFLRDGAYLQQFKDNTNEWFKEALEKEKRDRKFDLEIENLYASIKHNKSTRTISIIALIISGLSFLYLIIKDLLLKIIN